MSQTVTISSITANTPLNIYYCDALSANCEFVASFVSEFPFTFQVPSPIADTDFIVKIYDGNSCLYAETVYITPTPTNTLTPTKTATPTQTPSLTRTQTQTPTLTQTQTQTPTLTPTPSFTPTSSPIISEHPIGINVFAGSGVTVCYDTVSSTKLYTYISVANTTPVLGAVLYQTNLNGVLYNPYNGGNRFIKIKFGSDYYIMKINLVGEIIDYIICT